MNTPLLEVRNLKKHFAIRGGILYRQIAALKAVDGVDLKLHAGETLGIVGESGCGKSTLGRTILQLERPTERTVTLDGTQLDGLNTRSLRPWRRRMQMIFQDPFESLNPRHTVGQILEESFIIHKNGNAAERRRLVRDLLGRVGLPESATDRYPHEFSGGQRQRVGIARAISQRPRLLVCDEAVSALDVSVQSQVLNLLLELQRDMEMSYLFISHDLGVVRHVSDRVMVMYLGKVVEMAAADHLYSSARHPYTMALIDAIPRPDPAYRQGRHMVLSGDVPSPVDPPPGCRFHTRCPWVKDLCRQQEPTLAPSAEGDPDHHVACHFAGEISPGEKP